MSSLESQEQIRKRLVEAVRLSGMTQTDIAKKAGLSISMLTDYKNKKKLPTLVNLARLCEVLDISSDEILGLKR